MKYLLPKLLFAIVCLSAFLSCKKDKVIVYDFTQYTNTSDDGSIIGQIDSTDWQIHEEWNAAEKKLVSFNDTLIVTDTLSGTFEISPGYPNPTQGIVVLGMNPERQSVVRIACVNTEFEIIHYQSARCNGGPTWMGINLTQTTSFKHNEYYRIYYAVLNNTDSIVYNGHGDFFYP